MEYYLLKYTVHKMKIATIKTKWLTIELLEINWNTNCQNSRKPFLINYQITVLLRNKVPNEIIRKIVGDIFYRFPDIKHGKDYTFGKIFDNHFALSLLWIIGIVVYKRGRFALPSVTYFIMQNKVIDDSKSQVTWQSDCHFFSARSRGRTHSVTVRSKPSVAI